MSVMQLAVANATQAALAAKALSTAKLAATECALLHLHKKNKHAQVRHVYQRARGRDNVQTALCLSGQLTPIVAFSTHIHSSVRN